MTRAEEYRKRAKEAEAQAAKTRYSFTRESFLEVARQYWQMADDAERQGW
jgi:hypothetical protein